MDFGCQVFCISLKDRVDKQNFFTDLMKGLDIKFTFFDAIKDSIIPSRGCFKSHINIISNSNTNRVMVFEDDVDIRSDLKTSEVKTINKFLNTNTDWEVLFLGSTPKIWTHRIKKVDGFNGIYHGKFLGTYAYIINEKGLERYKNLKWGGKHKIIDRDVFGMNDHSYAYMPELYVQRIIKNDIGNDSVNWIRFRTHILDFVDWYALNINIPLYVIIIAVVVLVVIKIST